MMNLNLDKYFETLKTARVTIDKGKVSQVRGSLITGFLPGASLGSLCQITPKGAPSFLAEVVGFEGRKIQLMPLGNMEGVGLGSEILLLKTRSTVAVGDALLGRVVDGFCQPIDEKGSCRLDSEKLIYVDPENPLDRPLIEEPLSLGVRAIDGLLTVGRGQRVGILAGSGVGKSVLLGMMAQQTQADINVIVLIGERGREVNEFVHRVLDEEAREKSVVIVATSDQTALMRTRTAFVAMAVAEHFSEKGKSVLLMMDSITRFAMAQREIGLNIGEPPTTKGYTPSVYALLPKILERAGTFKGRGSITGLYTVLVEGDSMEDPIGDTVRSIVDGHIVLSRSLAQKNHFPAIDVLQSSSRVMRSVISEEHWTAANFIKENLAVFGEAEDLINIGAYREGANPKIDRAVKMNPSILSFLKQDMSEGVSMRSTIENLAQIIVGEN